MKQTFTVYFEIYGKKMKTSVEANNKEHAKQIIKDKIQFHKINNTLEELVDIVGMPKKP
jgi:1-deoxy-D-xylulose 5-phosphate reductoisomerase